MGEFPEVFRLYHAKAYGNAALVGPCCTHLTHDIHCAPEQNLHLCPRHIIRRALDLSVHTISGVIHHDVQPSPILVVLDGLEDRLDLGYFGHVQRQNEELGRRVERKKSLEGGQRAGGGDNAVALGEDVGYEGMSKTLG